MIDWLIIGWDLNFIFFAILQFCDGFEYQDNYIYAAQWGPWGVGMVAEKTAREIEGCA